MTTGDLRMNAYYYGFDTTGVRAIDEILSAVACAGKMYHGTDQWSNQGSDGEPSEVENIQAAAERAAREVERMRADVDRLREALVAAAADIREMAGGDPWSGDGDSPEQKIRAVLAATKEPA